MIRFHPALFTLSHVPEDPIDLPLCVSRCRPEAEIEAVPRTSNIPLGYYHLGYPIGITQRGISSSLSFNFSFITSLSPVSYNLIIRLAPERPRFTPQLPSFGEKRRIADRGRERILPLCVSFTDHGLQLGNGNPTCTTSPNSPVASLPSLARAVTVINVITRC